MNLPENLLIHTPTINESNLFLSTIEELGIMWAGGQGVWQIDAFDEYREDTCYRISNGRKLTYGSATFYRGDGRCYVPEDPIYAFMSVADFLELIGQDEPSFNADGVEELL